MARAGEFSRRMRSRGQQIMDGANRVKRLASFSILNALVFSTPVDTGRARANWLVDIDQPATGQVGTPGARPTNAPDPLALGQAIIDTASPGEAIHLTNNLDYIVPLNEGSSAQAPAGFVQAAVQTGAQSVAGKTLMEE